MGAGVTLHGQVESLTTRSGMAHRSRSLHAALLSHTIRCAMQNRSYRSYRMSPCHSSDNGLRILHPHSFCSQQLISEEGPVPQPPRLPICDGEDIYTIHKGTATPVVV